MAMVTWVQLIGTLNFDPGQRPGYCNLMDGGSFDRVSVFASGRIHEFVFPSHHVCISLSGEFPECNLVYEQHKLLRLRRQGSQFELTLSVLDKILPDSGIKRVVIRYDGGTYTFYTST